MNQINYPGTPLSDLLPMTLARLPGLQYRAIKEPQAYIEHAKETRIPPPDDKAVQMAIANPYREKARLNNEKRRMEKEQFARSMRLEKMKLESEARVGQIYADVNIQS